MVDKRLRQALRAVSEAVTAFSETAGDYERLLGAVARSTAQAVGDTCIVSLRSEDGATTSPVAMFDRDPEVVAKFDKHLNVQLPTGDAKLVGAAAAKGSLFMPMVDLDQLDEHVHPELLGFARSIGVHGMIVVALKSRGALLGAILVMRHRGDARAYDEIDLELAEHLANHAALALGNAKLFRDQQRIQEALHQSEMLRAAEAQAAEANRFVDAILENIPNMVFVKEANELRFVRFNKAGEELLGIPRSAMMGKNDYDFFPKAEADFFVQKDRETLDGKKLVDIAQEPIQTTRGSRWLHTKKVPICDEHGTPRYLLGISEDITERLQFISELTAARDKAEAANRELEAFSYSVAHDLRAPLRAIDGFSQALLEDHAGKLDATGQRHLDRIRAAAQRMATLIDALLDLSRVTRAELRREPVDLAKLARIAIAMLERGDPARKVEIMLPDELPARGDAKLLSIVFDNLLGNAWKFTAKAAQPRIEVGCDTVDGDRVYFVRDNGAGFDNAYRDKLFGVFQRLHKATDFPGTGIGLATVRRILERHGGRIWADGEVGKGATFSFTLSEAP